MVLIISIRGYYKIKSYIYLVPILIIGITAIGIIIIWIQNSHLDDSSVKMVAKHREDIAGNIYMEFKEDNSYKLDYYSILDGSRYRGIYKIENNTIYLDKKHPISEDENYMIDKLLIKGDSILFQLNEDGSYNESIFMKMEILID